MNNARPSAGASAFSGAGAPEAAPQAQAGGLGAVTVAGVSESALPAVSPVSDFMIYRLERALRERVRYRYVEPLVLREGESFRIQSPCCSRNVDPGGGLIDIALLTPGVADAGDETGAAGGWSLSARDHAAGVWLTRLQGQPLDTVLDALCLDSERQFWP